MSQSEARRLPLEVAWHRLIPSWPLLLGLVVFARLLAARMSLLNDPDTYLHIAAGRWILAHGALPLHDPFSHSLPGADWLASEWLAEIAFAAVYDHTGWGGVILLTAASVALAAIVLTHFLLRRLEPLPALIATAAAAALLQPHILARPHVLSLPLLVLWSAALLAARDDDRLPPFALLPVMVLWANIHSSFMFGLALTGYLGAEAVLRPRAGCRWTVEAYRWGGFLLAALLAALLTPYGVAALLQPIRLTQMPVLQSTFTEWLSPDFRNSPVLEMWLLGLLFLGYATGARLPLTRLVLLLGLVHLTLQHVRHADLLALVGPLAVAAPLGRALAPLTATEVPSRLSLWFGRLARPRGIPATALALAAAALLAAPLALRPVVRGDDPVTPGAALQAAARLDLTGPVFNSEPFGGYLIFRGVPTFIDGRMEMYGDAFLARDLEAERGSEAVLRGLLERYHIAWTLLLRQSGAVAMMDRLPGWERVYADDLAVIHRHSEGAPDGR
jgi:hypothetical protein